MNDNPWDTEQTEPELEYDYGPAPCPPGTCEAEHDGCGARDCPHGEPLHYHHDGCPCCDME